MKKVNFLGIGVDIENIRRFQKLKPDKNKVFLNKIFTQKELDHCFSKKTAAPHLAARYAAKEAIIKALSNFSKTIVDYKKIEILNDKSGAPTGKVKTGSFRRLHTALSLSHCKDKAIAFTVIYNEKK